jgi:hypothetical protein
VLGGILKQIRRCLIRFASLPKNERKHFNLSLLNRPTVVPARESFTYAVCARIGNVTPKRHSSLVLVAGCLFFVGPLDTRTLAQNRTTEIRDAILLGSCVSLPQPGRDLGRLGLSLYQ